MTESKWKETLQSHYEFDGRKLHKKKTKKEKLSFWTAVRWMLWNIFIITIFASVIISSVHQIFTIQHRICIEASKSCQIEEKQPNRNQNMHTCNNNNRIASSFSICIYFYEKTEKKKQKKKSMNNINILRRG